MPLIERSTLRSPPSATRPQAMPAMPPKIPAITVAATIFGSTSSAASSVPPLKPIQPMKSSSAPTPESTGLWPTMSSVGRPSRNRPMRGPITITAASATQAPTPCTTVAPAKSTKPMSPSHAGLPGITAPAQAQWPATG